MFYDIFVELCALKGVTRTKACVDCGVSRTAWRKWTDGGVPNGTTLSAFANYFGVTSDRLLGGEQKEKAPTPEGSRSVPHSKYREVLAEGGIRLMLDEDANVPKEHIDDIVEFIKFKQRKNGR